ARGPGRCCRQQGFLEFNALRARRAGELGRSLACFSDMATGTWSETEPSVEIATVDDLDRFVDFAEAKVERPTAISVDMHGYRVELLVGHETSFVHMTPEDEKPYHVTVGGPAEGTVNFWLHDWHHTEFENRHLVPKPLAREALREFFKMGRLSPLVEWEQYFA